MSDPVIYIVKSWVDPEVADRVQAWLQDGHVADVVSQPGIRNGRLYRLEETASDGWIGFVTVYEFDSVEAYERYQSSEARAKYVEEGKEYAARSRIERTWGVESYRTGVF